MRAASAHGTDLVVLSGGVFQNRRLLEAASAGLDARRSAGPHAGAASRQRRRHRLRSGRRRRAAVCGLSVDVRATSPQSTVRHILEQTVFIRGGERAVRRADGGRTRARGPTSCGRRSAGGPPPGSPPSRWRGASSALAMERDGGARRARPRCGCPDRSSRRGCGSCRPGAACSDRASRAPGRAVGEPHAAGWRRTAARYRDVMAVVVVFRCDICGARPDPETQFSLERQLLDLRHGEYVDADPGRWLTWHGRGIYGPASLRVR